MIEKRREFVRALWQEQCPKNSYKRLYTVKGLLVLVEKASFSKEFRCEFHSGGKGYNLDKILFDSIWNHNLLQTFIQFCIKKTKIAYRPRMEKLHSKHHELHFQGIVSIVVVLTVETEPCLSTGSGMQEAQERSIIDRLWFIRNTHLE